MDTNIHKIDTGTTSEQLRAALGAAHPIRQIGDGTARRTYRQVQATWKTRVLAACELGAAAGLLVSLVLFLQTKQETILAGEVQVGDTVIGEQPLPAVSPFDAKQAGAYQEAWARHLDTKVEIENSLGMKLRLIPPGEFMMGSQQDEIDLWVNSTTDRDAKGWFRSEGPQHRVKLTQAFYLGSCEVTQRQYQEVMGVNPSHYSPTGSAKEIVKGLDTSEHPVDSVNWFDAVDFCNKLSEKEQRPPYYVRDGETVKVRGGVGYRLPTEAEWEYACRAGTTKRWFFDGDTERDLIQHAWFYSDDISRTHRIAGLVANPFGLYDLYGNVWEWCWDWHGVYAAGTVSDPSGSPAGSERVLRGGAFYDFPSFCRTTARFKIHPMSSADPFGFRVCCGQ